MRAEPKLQTWEGELDSAALDRLVALLPQAIFIGQRAGDFTLGRQLVGGTQTWSAGRCFNPDSEIRWWPLDGEGGTERGRSVLILNQLPPGFDAPAHWARPVPLVGSPDEKQFICVGQYDRTARAYWEPRYGRAFEYFGPAAAETMDEGTPAPERAALRAAVYEYKDGRTQHRLLGFVSARSAP